MKTFTTLLTIAGLATSAFAGPILRVGNAGVTGTIADKYIVVLKDGVDVEAHTSRISALHAVSARDLSGPKSHGVQRKFSFKNSGFRGYTGGFDAATLQQILRSPDVAFVEQDAIVKLSAEQTGSTWGLDRISHKQFASPYSYLYDPKAGSGTTIYVIDTGIRISHSEFKSSNGTRAVWGYNAVDSTNTDGNGHGTHCAGTAAGKTYGVSKNAKVVAVKVLDSNGSGSNSGVIAGMNWVAKNAKPNYSVASMSLGGGKSAAINSAAKAIFDAGVTIVVAAGNEKQPAGNVSPASAPDAITVGAVDVNNKLASFSNYGSVVDVLAPGVNVLSSWNTGDSATNTISGTSMACPHVAGLAAYFISTGSTGGPAAVTNTILNNALTGIFSGLPSGTPNKLAYNAYETKK